MLAQGGGAINGLPRAFRRGYHAAGGEEGVTASVVWRTWNDHEAELVKGILESYGIPVRLDADITHLLYPCGETRVMVPLDAEDEANSILAGHRARTGLIDA
jgi:hypothetical protein